MKVLVVGAGASGLVCAIKLKERGIDVTIIEKNSKLGKKLLLTGNGRCNYWNEVQSSDKYYSSDRDILKQIINSKKEQVLPFFDNLGIIPKVINGYYYPYSNQATTIVKALENKLVKLKINVIYDEEVLDIAKEQKFIVKTSKNTYIYDKVVLAMGGKANPKTGSDGLGYKLATNLGHTIRQVVPALVYIEGKDNYYQDWDGVRSEAILTLVENEKIIKQEKGEVQFTKLGISGICTFNLSGDVALGLASGKKEEIYLNLVPWFQGSKKDFKEFLNKQSKKLKNYTIGEILEGFLNKKLVNLILKLTKIKYDQKWEEINKDLIIEYLVNFKFNIKETGDFVNAQVCLGGVSLMEIDSNTLESKLVKGLYFTGEILDAHGVCGGYNLGLAWMTGLIVGDNLND